MNFIQKIDEIPEKPQDDSEDSGDENSDSDEEENASKSVGEENMAIEKESNPNESNSGQNKPELQVTPPPDENPSKENTENSETKMVEEKKGTQQAQRLSVGEGKLRKKNSRKSADRLKNKKSNATPIQIPEKESIPEQNLSPQPSPLQLKDLNLVNYLFGFLCREVTNPTLAGYFEVCVKNLMNHKTSKVGRLYQYK